jgi:3-oxoacyl-(acyl-carrier-protein) synthase
VSSILVKGIGVVSPAGWGMAPFRDALAKNLPLTPTDLPRPGWEIPLRIRRVPAPQPRPAFLAHARLRRASPISQYAVAAGIEALGEDKNKIATGELRLGIILCAMSGSVNYSRRFFDETLRDPATASPLVFPETVFNAPSSHLAALLGTNAINYTLVGDSGTFLQALALAADWLGENRVEGCLVLGAEEHDWLTSDAYRLFAKEIVLGDGAGAVYLSKGNPSANAVELECVTDSHLFLNAQNRQCAAQKMKSELCKNPKENALLCDGLIGIAKLDFIESNLWNDWSGARISPKEILGDGLAAASAWQCVAAIDALQTTSISRAEISVIGTNQQAIGASFAKISQ